MDTMNTTPLEVPLTDELRAKALARARDTLIKLDEVRRSLELLPDQLPLVIDAYAQAARGLLFEEQQKKMAERTKRLPLPVLSCDREGAPMKVKPGKPFQVAARPQYSDFRVEDISIHGDRSRWLVHDLRVGGRSQFMQQGGPIPGQEFGPGGVCASLRLATCQTAMDFVMIVEYLGPETDGEVFEATAVGLAVEG